MGRGELRDTTGIGPARSRSEPSRAAYAWGGLSSDGHEWVQDALRSEYLGWSEEQVEVWHPDGLDFDYLTIGQLVGELDAEVDAAPGLPDRTELFRGVKDLPALCRLAGVDDASRLPGRRVSDPGYLATSRDPEIAAFHGHDAVIEIEAPAGSTALDLTKCGIPDQQEVLFPRGSTVEFLGAAEERGTWRLQARLVK